MEFKRAGRNVFVKQLLLAILLAAAVAAMLGYLSQPYVQEEEGIQKIAIGGSAGKQAQADKVYLLLPAVDDAGRGRLAEILVEASPGSGKAFIAFQEDTPLLSPDTQESLKIAIELGKLLATRDVNKLDLKYTMNAPSAIVGGKSAGAAVAVATIALLQGTQLRGDTLITGGIDASGNILRVGGILEKARAVKEAGFRKLVVPPGEKTAFVVREECAEERVPGGVFRRCQARSVQVDVASEVGIEIAEASDMREALAEMRA